MNIIQIALSLVAITSFFQIGFLIDFLINKKHDNLFVPAFLGLGFGFVTIAQTILGFLHLSLTREIVFAFILFLQFVFIANKYIRNVFVHTIFAAKNKIGALNPLILFLFISTTFFVLLNTFNHMIWGYDTWAIWLSKAHAFWIDGKITPQNIHIYYPYDNPLLWPLIVTWFYHITGESGGYWVRIIPFSIYLSLCLTFILEKKRLSFIHQIFMLVFALTPFVWQSVTFQEYGGNADLLVSYYFLLAVVSIIIRKNLLYASIFLILAVITKNDAIPGVICFFVSCLVLLKRDWQKNRALLLPLAILIGGFVLNGVWRINYGLTNRYAQRDIWLILKSRPFIQYVKYSIHAFREEFRQLYRWGVGWWIIFFVLCMHIKKILTNRFLLLPFLIIISQFIGYIYAYYITPEDQATQISGSVYRLALQLYPSLLFIVFVFLQENTQTVRGPLTNTYKNTL